MLEVTDFEGVKITVYDVTSLEYVGKESRYTIRSGGAPFFVTKSEFGQTFATTLDGALDLAKKLIIEAV